MVLYLNSNLHSQTTHSLKIDERVSVDNHLQVLIVDATSDNQILLIALFQMYGVHSLVATSAAEAISILTQVQLNLIVSEIWLPGEDGYSFMRRVKALEVERNIRIPAFAVTSYRREFNHFQALPDGFDRHFSIPLDIDEFLIGVAEVVCCKF